MEPLAEAIGRAYSRDAEEYAAALPDLSFEADQDRELLERFARSVPRASDGASLPVLDAGCGTGRLFAPLRAWGLGALSGCDASEGMLAVARREHPEVPVRLASLSALGADPGSLGGVLLWYSIIHLSPEAVPGIARGVAEVLRPGGVSLWAFHAGAADRDSLRADGEVRPLTVYAHGVREIAATLIDAGLEILEATERPARAAERDAQGFVLARLRAPSPGRAGKAAT